jgi:hypothetical protein
MPIHAETSNITARQAFRCCPVLSAGRAGPVSVVLAVHGGAWTSGDRFNKVFGGRGFEGDSRNRQQ